MPEPKDNYWVYLHKQAQEAFGAPHGELFNNMFSFDPYDTPILKCVSVGPADVGPFMKLEVIFPDAKASIDFLMPASYISFIVGGAERQRAIGFRPQ